MIIFLSRNFQLIYPWEFMHELTYMGPVPNQGHPSPPRNEVRGPSSPNFPKHGWFQNVIWRHDLP